MEKKILLFLILFNSFCFGQTVLFSEDFESYPDFTINNFGQWSTLDLDGLSTWTLGGDMAPPTNWVATWPNAGAPMAFQIFNPSNANVTNNDPFSPTGDPNQEFRNFNAHSGNKYAGSWAGKMVVSNQGNKDWLISPPITLGSTGNTLSLWVKTLSNGFGDERYAIGVYNGAGNPTSSSNFVVISATPYALASGNSTWQKITFNLDSFQGQTIRFGIECLTQEGSMLMVDDVLLTSAVPVVLSTSENITAKTSVTVYPNPANEQIFIFGPKIILKSEIYDIEGKKIIETSNTQIEVKNLRSGVYLVKSYLQDNSSVTNRFIKK